VLGVITGYSAFMILFIHIIMLLYIYIYIYIYIVLLENMFLLDREFSLMHVRI
jgi:hypothetical protein